MTGREPLSTAGDVDPNGDVVDVLELELLRVARERRLRAATRLAVSEDLGADVRACVTEVVERALAGSARWRR